jgi:hypothetical protein
MRYIVAIISSALLLLLSGCATVQTASIDQDAKAKDFLPIKNHASLYIYRNENLGAAIPMTVTLNGKALGQTAAKTYFRLNLAPGKYVIESHAENVSILPLTLEAEKNYFVWQEVKMGMWMARNMLQQTDETTARAGIMESKLIALLLNENDILPLDVQPRSSQTPSTLSNDAISQKLRELQSLRKDGIITEDEFQKKKAQLLEKL